MPFYNGYGHGPPGSYAAHLGDPAPVQKPYTVGNPLFKAEPQAFTSSSMSAVPKLRPGSYLDLLPLDSPLMQLQNRAAMCSIHESMGEHSVYARISRDTSDSPDAVPADMHQGWRSIQQATRLAPQQQQQQQPHQQQQSQQQQLQQQQPPVQQQQHLQQKQQPQRQQQQATQQPAALPALEVPLPATAGAMTSDNYQAQVIQPLMATLTQARQQAAIPTNGMKGRTGAAATQPPNMEELHQQVGQRMGQMYAHFEKLYETDQKEIRKLRRVVVAGHGSAEQQPGDDAYIQGIMCDASVSRPQSKVIVFLPYTMDPYQRATRWWPLLLASWQAKRTTWLFIIWACIFFVAVALLIGLLVPWHKAKHAPNFTRAPAVLNITASGIDLSVSLDRSVTVFYAAIPSALVNDYFRRQLLQKETISPLPEHPALTSRLLSMGHGATDFMHFANKQAARQLPSDPGLSDPLTQTRAVHRQLSQTSVQAPSPSPPPASPPPPSPPPPTPVGVLAWIDQDELIQLVQGEDAARLAPYAASCGAVSIQDTSQPYNLSLPSGGDQPPTLECSTHYQAFAGNANTQRFSSVPRRCIRCPSLLPLTESYLLLLVAVRTDDNRIQSTLQTIQLTPSAGGWVAIVNNQLQGPPPSPPPLAPPLPAPPPPPAPVVVVG